MGKTRLVSELAGRAAGRGFTVLSGRCAELGDSMPTCRSPTRCARRPPAPAATRPLLDAIAARPVLRRLLPDRGASPPPADLPGLAQQQLFGAVLGMLAELAAQRPVLLVLEDLHWADRSTRDLLTFLSRVLHRERVAVVVTYRTDDLHRRHPLRPVVGGAAPPARGDRHRARPARLRGHGRPSERAGRSSPLDAATAAPDRHPGRGNPYYGEELLAAGSGRGEQARAASFRPVSPTCSSPGSSRSPTPPSRCCGRRAVARQARRRRTCIRRRVRAG